MKRFKLIDLLTTFLITGIGIYRGEVTIFYIIYLFWWQELLRTIIDLVRINSSGLERPAKQALTGGVFSAFFVLGVYLVFIIILFGFMFNFSNDKLLALNLQTLLFRNLFFNLNLIIFGIQYALYISGRPPELLKLQAFNRRHIILHVSIILGAVVRMFIFGGREVDSVWMSIAGIAPFLLLKIWLDRD